MYCRHFAGTLLILLTVAVSVSAQGLEPPGVQAKRLFSAGVALADKSHYLEALDLFQECRQILDNSGKTRTDLSGDVLYALAETKIKARIHQGFPASYVKSALKDIQAANRLRERLQNVLPQKLAEGYYLEGKIHKQFFMKRKKARSLFEKCMKLDPGHSAGKRELSELITD